MRLPGGWDGANTMAGMLDWLRCCVCTAPITLPPCLSHRLSKQLQPTCQKANTVAVPSLENHFCPCYFCLSKKKNQYVCLLLLHKVGSIVLLSHCNGLVFVCNVSLLVMTAQCYESFIITFLYHLSSRYHKVASIVLHTHTPWHHHHCILAATEAERE